MTSLEKPKECGGYGKQEALQGHQQTGLITARLQEVISSRFSQFEPCAGVSEGITSLRNDDLGGSDLLPLKTET